MKRYDIFSDLKLDHVVFIRTDGVNFSRACKELNLEKPYDIRLIEALIEASKKIFDLFSPKMAYMFSDEINFLFFPPLPYKGRIEKLDSIISSYVSSIVSLKFNKILAFDAKVLIVDSSEIIDYLIKRQNEAWRNHINSYAYYTLIKEGLSGKEAAQKLKGLKYQDLHELLFSRGINPAKTPLWQRRGVMLYKRKSIKKGFDPRTKKETVTMRTEIYEDWNLPNFNTEEGRNFLKTIIEGD